MQEKRKFICSHCDFTIEFPADDCEQRRLAWKAANEHEATCDKNPLVLRIKALETQLKAIPAPVADSSDGAGIEALEVLRLIHLECRKQSALSKETRALVGFNNIDRLVERIIPPPKK